MAGKDNKNTELFKCSGIIILEVNINVCDIFEDISFLNYGYKIYTPLLKFNYKFYNKIIHEVQNGFHKERL